MLHHAVRAARGFASSSAAITLVGVVSAENASNSTSLDVAKPSGVQAGDLLIAIMGAGSSTGTTWSQPSGWTEARDSGTSPNIGIAYKVATAGEPSTYSFASANSIAIGVTILAYRGAAIDVVGALGTVTTAAVATTAPSITMTSANALLIAVFMAAGASRAWGTPSGMALAVTKNDSRAPSYIVATQAVGSGSTGTRSATPTGTGSNVAVLIGLKPG